MSNSTLAPSEKHLEDWIVANPQLFDSASRTYSFVCRQIHLPSGIPDLIGFRPVHGLTVFELKRGKSDAKSLAQCLRYMRDIKNIAAYALAEIRDPFELGLLQGDPETKGILIGNGIPDDNLLISADMAGVTVIDYEYHSENNTYTFKELRPRPHDDLASYEFSRGVLGDCIRAAYCDTVEAAIENMGVFHIFKYARECMAHMTMAKFFKRGEMVAPAERFNHD